MQKSSNSRNLLKKVGIKLEEEKKEGQEALNRSPEFCLKLTYMYLLKAGHVPGDTWGGANFGPRSIIRTNFVEVH